MCRGPRSVPCRFPGCRLSLSESLWAQISWFCVFSSGFLYPSAFYNPSFSSSRGLSKLYLSLHLFPSVAGCGSLNVFIPHNLLGSSALGGVALSERKWPCWRKCVTVRPWGFYTQDTTQCLIQLPVACISRCSQHHICLHTIMRPTVVILNWTSETPIKYFPFKSCHAMVPLHSRNTKALGEDSLMTVGLG